MARAAAWPPERVVMHGAGGFALTAMFVILAIDAVRANRDFRLVSLAFAASLVALLFDRYVYDESFIVVGLLVYLVALTAMYRAGVWADGG